MSVLSTVILGFEVYTADFMTKTYLRKRCCYSGCNQPDREEYSHCPYHGHEFYVDYTYDFTTRMPILESKVYADDPHALTRARGETNFRWPPSPSEVFHKSLNAYESPIYFVGLRAAGTSRKYPHSYCKEPKVRIYEGSCKDLFTTYEDVKQLRRDLDFEDDREIKLIQLVVQER